jgi:hypothetical protein
MAEVDTRITPALPPDNIASLDGYSEATAPLVADAAEALEAAYTYLGSIHDVRAAAFADPTLTKEPTLRAQSQTVEFDLDPTLPLAAQVEQVLAAISMGKLAPDVGRQIIEAIGTLGNIRATEDLEARIIQLEAKEVR